MAAVRTWTLLEMVKAIEENDMVSIKDITRRFPMTSMMLARADKRTAEEILSAIPEYITVIGVERKLTGVKASGSENEAEEVQEEAETDVAEGEAPEGKDKLEKRRETDRIRQQRRREKLKDKAKAQESLEEKEEDPVEIVADKDAEKGSYDEIGAVELFKMCKARGLDVKPRQKQRFYIDLLEQDDAEKMELDDGDAEEDDDDWGEDPEQEEEEAPVEEKPAKEAKKSSNAKKSPAKKKDEPKEEPADEEEEDWNI